MPRLKGVKTNKIKTNKNQVDQEDRIKHSCCKMFEKRPKDLDIIINIIESKTTKKTMNIKFIEWFITEYCRTNPVFINDEHVYTSFKNSSKTYSKKYFNIMRRGNKLTLSILDKDVNTSVSQINFLKWYVNNKIHPYVEEHFDKLYEVMSVQKED